MTNSTVAASSPSSTSSPTQLTRVTVVVPCFNEEEGCDNFFQRVQALRAAVRSQYDLFFVIVDDGSSDNSYQALTDAFQDEEGCRVVRHGANRGVAAALMTGIRHAQTEIVCSMDFDCSYDPLQLVQMIPLLTDGIDIVTASPYHPDGEVRNVPRWRLALSKAASRMYSWFLHNQLHTYTSCFRVYRRRSVQGIDLKHQGFVGVVELLWEVDRRGGRIVECPATLGVREYGQSKMRTFEVTLGHLRLMTTNPFRR